jgi:hypothetical protein
MAILKSETNQTRWHRMTPEQQRRRLEQMRAWQAANKDRVRSYYKYQKKTNNAGYGTKQAKAKYEFVRDAKIAIGKCADCEFPCDDITHVCFAFDHIDPSQKRFSLSKNRKYTFDEIRTEIDKCELVCHNCHAIRTYLNGHNRTVDTTSSLDQPTLF